MPEVTSTRRLHGHGDWFRIADHPRTKLLYLRHADCVEWRRPPAKKVFLAYMPAALRQITNRVSLSSAIALRSTLPANRDGCANDHSERAFNFATGKQAALIATP